MLVTTGIHGSPCLYVFTRRSHSCLYASCRCLEFNISNHGTSAASATVGRSFLNLFCFGPLSAAAPFFLDVPYVCYDPDGLFWLQLYLKSAYFHTLFDKMNSHWNRYRIHKIVFLFNRKNQFLQMYFSIFWQVTISMIFTWIESIQESNYFSTLGKKLSSLLLFLPFSIVLNKVCRILMPTTAAWWYLSIPCFPKSVLQFT